MTPEELVGPPSPESALIGPDEGMAQPPADGFVRPAQQAQQPDPLMDDEALKAAALDHRGSRQIAPYGTYEAVDAAIQNGYYTGLEALDFGTLPDGTPAALFTDQRGQRQAIRMSQEQWSAGLQTRAQARIAMAKQMRNQQESQRLMPAVEKMAQELEAAAPGFMDYAAMNMENDPRGTYSMVQSMYDKFKAGDKQVMREMAKASDQASLQVGQAQAESWAKNKNEMLTTQAEGIMDDDSIPEEFKAQYVQELRRKMASNNRFAFLTPPVGGIRRTASFPSWYASQSNPGAIDDLADTTITDVGYQNIAQLPRPQQIQFLMQRSMAISREIGWSMPFGQADIAMVSNALDRRLQAMSPPPMMQPNQVAGNQAPEAQQIRGTMSQMQRGQQEREQANQMAQAKIAETESRALWGANRAEFAPAMSQAELESKQARTGQTQASTDLTQARAASAQVDAQYAAQRQQARIAEMRARAAQGDAESERKLAEVDVLLGLTPEEAKTAKTQRETERKSRSTEPAPSSQQSQSGSPDEREAFIRSLAAEAGIEMEDTGNIKNDVMSTIKRLDGAKGMLANTQRNKWLGILAKAEQKYR
jgi:hypothetical protein